MNWNERICIKKLISHNANQVRFTLFLTYIIHTVIKIYVELLMILFGVYHFSQTKRKKGEQKTSIRLEFDIGLLILILAAILTHLPNDSIA
jgi:putative copper export protein